MSIGGPSNRDYVIAIKEGDEETVRKRLKSGHELYLKSINSRLTTLHLAAKTGNVEIMNMLLKSGKMQLDEQTTKAGKRIPSGQTALHIAILFGNEDVAIKLMEAGADKNIPDSNGNTPAHIAAVNGSQNLMNQLAKSHQSQKPADLLLRNNMGETVIRIGLNNSNLDEQFLEELMMLTSTITPQKDLQKKQSSSFSQRLKEDRTLDKTGARRVMWPHKLSSKL